MVVICYEIGGLNLKEYFYDFLLMIQFFTRVPINKSLPCEKKNFKDGANFSAAVGLLIGICQYLLFILLIKIIATNFVVIAIIVFDIIITGALHIDGFGDTCDGFFAFKGGKDKIIEIMKDSRIGTFACISIVLNILIKYQGYLFLLQNKNPLFIIIIPMISKFSIVFLSFIGKPAKENGSGNLFINNVGLKEVAVNTVIIMIAAFLSCLVFETMILFAAALIITILFNIFCNSKINGVTGDSLGANNELVVLLSLVIISMM